jgi:hypothetical protein
MNMEKIGGVDVVTFTEPSVKVFDNPHGVELFVEGMHSMFATGSVCSIAFYSPKLAPDGEMYRVIVGRIVIPAVGAHALAVGLFDFLSKVGLNPEGQALGQGSSKAN